MGKYLDKTGLQYFYGKLKEKFADKTTIENKLDSLTGALTWKGKFDALPTVADYETGNVVGVGNKKYVLTVTGSTKAWEGLGDEGSYLLKSAAEETYAKKTSIPTVNNPKVSIKMNGAEKGSFTLNQAAAGEADLGTVITSHQDISGKVDKTSLTPILQEIDLTGTDEERKAKLGQFETDWKALTGASDMSGARFVGKVTISGVGKSCLFTHQTIGTYDYVGFVYSIDSDDNINPVKVGLEYDEVGVHIHVAPAVEIATIAEIDKLFAIKTGSL